MTTRGRCLLAGGIAAAVCAVLLDERDLLRVGILAAVLPVIAVLLTRRGRPRLSTAARVVPPHLPVGEDATVEIRMRNVGRRRLGRRVVTQPPHPHLTDGFRRHLPPLRPGATVGIRYRITAPRRGRFPLGVLHIDTGDSLGLSAGHTELTLPAEILVLPQVVPLRGLPRSLGARPRAESAAQAGGTAGDLDVRVRPYTSGDDIRSIHWRASARRDEWVVRTRAQHASGAATVLIDHRLGAHAGRGADSSLEMAVSMAASIASHLLAADFQLRVTTHRGRLLAAGETSPMAVLADLADLPADTGQPEKNAVPLLCDVPSEAGLILAVTGGLTARDVAALVSSKPPSARAIAFVADVPGWADTAERNAGAGDTLPTDGAAAALRDGGWRVQVLSRGADLAAAWAAESMASTSLRVQL